MPPGSSRSGWGDERVSQRMWNRGLADACEGTPARYPNDRDYMDGYSYGSADDDRYQAEPGPEPPEPEDICAGSGHPIFGRDEIGWRCYCGEKRYTDQEAQEAFKAGG